MIIRLSPVLLLMATLGCTFDDGTGFATLEEASIAARLEVGSAKRVDDRTLRTDLGYEVTLDALLVIVEAVTLSEDGAASEGEPGMSDPAEPGAGPSLRQVVSLPGGDVDGLTGAELRLDAVEPSRELPRSEISWVVVLVHELAARGTVRRDAEELTFDIRVPVEGSLTDPVTLVIDEDGPTSLDLRVDVAIADILFDGLDFSGQAIGGAVDVRDAAHPVAVELARAFATSSLTTELDTR